VENSTTLLLSVAYALFVTGIIVTVHHQFSHKILLRLLVRILVLTSLLVLSAGVGKCDSKFVAGIHHLRSGR
jgi:hypothetical protein